jgi:hypothetical protein
MDLRALKEHMDSRFDRLESLVHDNRDEEVQRLTKVEGRVSVLWMVFASAIASMVGWILSH